MPRSASPPKTSFPTSWASCAKRSNAKWATARQSREERQVQKEVSMSIDTRVNPKPEVVTNRDGKTVAGALQTYWSHLITNLRESPSLAIATAYFNPGGFRLLADQLEEARGVRLLLGAEPDVADDLRRIRTLRHDVLPEDAPRERLRQALREHHQLMQEDRDLSAFDPAT